MPRRLLRKPAAKKAMDFGLREVNEFVKGPGVGREIAIRTLGVLA
jgi:small subunit ribosomal protein S11